MWPFVKQTTLHIARDKLSLMPEEVQKKYLKSLSWMCSAASDVINWHTIRQVQLNINIPFCDERNSASWKDLALKMDCDFVIVRQQNKKFP